MILLRLRRMLLLAFFLLPRLAVAQDARKPYDVRVVVLCAEHRFLKTDYFQDQFPRDIAERTKLALGSLVEIEAMSDHPLRPTIHQGGLDAALAGFRDASNKRTWFFTVDHRGGLFRIQGRFFDGLSGLLGPAARTETTPDRDRLASLAAAMIAEPFALVGAATRAKGDQIDLSIHGGGLGEHVKLPAGSVLAVSKIRVGQPQAHRIEWAVLETIAPLVAGSVPCTFRHRYAEDTIRPGGDVIYRALVLPTKNAPLRLRVVDRESGRPLAGIGVAVAGPQPIELITDPTGLAVTSGPVSKLARVTLTLNGKAIAQLPVPILGDDVVTCEVSPKPDVENLAGIDVRRRQLLARINDAYRFHDQRSEEQRVLLAGSALEKSLEHAETTRRVLDREIADDTAELGDITQSKPFPEGKRDLAALVKRRETVNDLIGRITVAIRDRDISSEKRKQADKLVLQAALLESQGEFDQAIKHYGEAAKLLPEGSKVAEKLAALKSDWEKDRGPRHKECRNRLIVTWPALPPDELGNQYVVMKDALDECKKTDDRLSPRRFVRAGVEHLDKIKKIVESLKTQRPRPPDLTERLAAWNDIVERVRELTNQAVEQTKQE